MVEDLGRRRIEEHEGEEQQRERMFPRPVEEPAQDQHQRDEKNRLEIEAIRNAQTLEKTPDDASARRIGKAAVNRIKELEEILVRIVQRVDDFAFPNQPESSDDGEKKAPETKTANGSGDHAVSRGLKNRWAETKRPGPGEKATAPRSR